MPLTPSVGTGQIITPTWGNEIRDRSFQQFASKAQLDTWAAPDGSPAWTLDTLTPWVRIAGVWRPYPDRGKTAGTTDAAGRLTATHKVGAVPTSAFVMSQTTAVWGTVDSMTTTTIIGRFFTGAGAAYVGAITFSWVAWP